MAVEVTLQPGDKSFTDAELKAIADKVVAAAAKLGAMLAWLTGSTIANGAADRRDQPARRGAVVADATPTGRELMTDADPAFWTGRAPILFPIVGGWRATRSASTGANTR